MATPAALEDLTWPEDMADHLTAWAASGLVFSADDTRISFRQPPHGNMIGAAYTRAAQAGLIRLAGYKQSTATSRKHSLIRTWVGTTKGGRNDCI